MVRISCIRLPPGPGTRAQHTTSALPISSAGTRSTTSGSSVSTCIALASAHLGRNLGDHPWELQGTANLILVLAAHETAHSTAPGARLQTGLTRPGDYDVNGWPLTIFSPERRSPTGANGTSGPSEALDWQEARHLVRFTQTTRTRGGTARPVAARSSSTSKRERSPRW